MSIITKPSGCTVGDSVVFFTMLYFDETPPPVETPTIPVPAGFTVPPGGWTYSELTGGRYIAWSWARRVIDGTEPATWTLDHDVFVDAKIFAVCVRVTQAEFDGGTWHWSFQRPEDPHDPIEMSWETYWNQIDMVLGDTFVLVTFGFEMLYAPSGFTVIYPSKTGAGKDEPHANWLDIFKRTNVGAIPDIVLPAEETETPKMAFGVWLRVAEEEGLTIDDLTVNTGGNVV